jgi:flagellar basal body-associated protein FliL
MSIAKDAKRRIQHQGNDKQNNNKKKKKIPLIIIGSAFLMGGIACGVALPLTCSSKTVEPFSIMFNNKPEHVEAVFEGYASVVEVECTTNLDDTYAIQ